jgi:hypothetical protein
MVHNLTSTRYFAFFLAIGLFFLIMPLSGQAQEVNPAVNNSQAITIKKLKSDVKDKPGVKGRAQ